MAPGLQLNRAVKGLRRCASIESNQYSGGISASPLAHPPSLPFIPVLARHIHPRQAVTSARASFAAAAASLPRLACAGIVCVCLLAAAPSHADTLSDARALTLRGEAAEALRRVDAALTADNRDVQLRFLRGVLLMDLKRDGEALALFNQMSLEFPELPDPFNNIALLQVRAGRLDEARTALETALRNDPTHRMAHANLGQVHLMLAARSWQTLAALGPLEPLLEQQLNAVRVLLQTSAEPRSTKPKN